MIRNYLLVVATILFCATSVTAQELITDEPLIKHTWKAQWIGHPHKSPTEYGVYHFRKTFILDQKPKKLIVHVSADNRYRLFVNGTPICSGPAISDLANWHYESIDISSYLQEGRNVIAAQVYNFGEHRPGRQISYKTSFILQSDPQLKDDINTNNNWKALNNEAYRVIPMSPETVEHYYRIFGFYTASPGDEVNAADYPWGWEQLNYDDQHWENAKVIKEDAVTTGVGRGYAYGSTRFLIPSPLKLLQETEERNFTIARSSGFKPASNLLKQNKEITIPKNTKATLLLDAERMSIGYPELTVSKGKNSKIKITYAEALFDENFRKGNRNEIDGKQIYGIYDIFLPDGGMKRSFRPLWLRAFRFIQFDIETQEEELVINEFVNHFSAYPVQQIASLETSDPNITRIMDVGWRTLQLCAQDNFFSDAYFEQMQYVGDARTQALATYFMTGNLDLFRQAIRQIDMSRIPEGLTQSRYPARELQIIPSYSLAWIAMIHDYMMIDNDHDFVKPFIPGIRNVLYWFQNKVDSNGLLGNLTWWYFPDREPNENKRYDNYSTLANLQFTDALQKAGDIFIELGLKEEGENYKNLADKINHHVYNLCYRSSEGMFSESPISNMFTQGTNAMAIVAGALPKEKQQELMQKILNDKRVRESTLYYKFYVNRAMEESGYTQAYFDQLYPWNIMLSNGMTTYGEVANNPRSDCHPWSAVPNIDLFTIVCGVQSSAFGFKKVTISPAFGPLNFIKATIPHPNGEIRLNLRKDNKNRVQGLIYLPEGVTGTFDWNGKQVELKEGDQQIAQMQ